MRLLKRFWFLFLILLIEGSALMAVELMGAKLLAPFYGSSLYVWTAVLCVTVLGLTLGYYYGGRISTENMTERKLVFILGISALIVLALPATAKLVILMSSGMNLIFGIFLASLLLLAPPLFCFGLVGPIVVRLMAQNKETIGNVSGTVYFTSTFGGILATFFFGLYLIPEIGLKLSSLITAIALAFIPGIYFIKNTLMRNRVELAVVQEQQEQSVKVNPSSKSKSKHRSNNQIKQSVYLFAVLEGAAVMAIQLIAAHMLEPYFGSSLNVWATVIGVTLLSLALAYYLGGRLADKYNPIATIHWVLLISSVFTMLMYYSTQLITTSLMQMDLKFAVILVSLSIIVPSLLFIGMLPTLLIRYLTDKVDNAGAITGKVFTVSSASGILALLIMGFFIIPRYGLTMPSILIGLFLGIIPFIKLIAQKKYSSLVFVLVAIFSFSNHTLNSASTDVKVLHQSEGLLGQLLVADVFKNGDGSTSNDRVLFINRMGQTFVDRTTGNSKWTYITFTTSIVSKLPVNSKALVLGLGGGSLANNLQNNLGLSVDAVELDQRIVNIAQQYFSLNPNISIHVDDARHYLENTTEKYDLIFFDVFRGDVQPSHVMSLECFQKAKSLLNDNGLLILNFNGFLNGEAGRAGRSIYATLLAANFKTSIFPTPGKENERNLLFVATAAQQKFDQLRSPLYHLKKRVDIDSLFIDPENLDLSGVDIFTDDRSKLDRLNQKANYNWRKSYNSSFTKFFLENGIPLYN